jgi:hypothetical protein
MIITNVLVQLTVVTATKTNVHETTADARLHDIAPTTTRTAQAITTETAHHSTMTKRNISILLPNFTPHHRKLAIPRDITRTKRQGRKEQKTHKKKR